MWVTATPDTLAESLRSNYSQNSISQTKGLERTQWRGLETVKATEKIVMVLEGKLNIVRRWTKCDEEWIAADRTIAEQDYRLAVDTLEGLVVARLFELSKMNR